MIRAVFFDVGETLIDETRDWEGWADWLGVPRLTFLATLGIVLAQDEHHRQVFEYFSPDFDFKSAVRQRMAEGWRYGYHPDDLYLDAVPCCAELRNDGYFVGIAGNQPAEALLSLRSLGLGADIIETSETWGVEKPNPEFFSKIVEVVNEACGPTDPSQIAYVGDRIDNDIEAATEAGLVAIWLSRGPWAIAQRSDPGVSKANYTIASLAELPGLVNEISLISG